MMRSASVVLQQLERDRRVSAFVERVRMLLAWFQNTKGLSPARREIMLLDYLVRWLEWGALAQFGEIDKVSGKWQAAITYLRSLLVHAPDWTPPQDSDPQGESDDGLGTG